MDVSLPTLTWRHIRAELVSPLMWLAVALTPFVFVAMSPHDDGGVQDAKPVAFLLAATAASWIIGLPTACILRLALMRIGVKRTAAVFVAAFAMLLPITLAVELLEAALMGEPLHILNIAKCYGELLGVAALFVFGLDYLVGRTSDRKSGADEWFAEARHRVSNHSGAECQDEGGLGAAVKHQLAQIVRADLFWTMAATFYAVFTFLGPIGTYEALTLTQRFGIFAIVFAMIIVFAGPLIVALRILLSRRGWNIYVAIAFAAAIGGLAMCYPLHLVIAHATGGTISLADAAENYLIFTPALILSAVLTYEIVNIGALVPAADEAREEDAAAAIAWRSADRGAWDARSIAKTSEVPAGLEAHPRAAILELLPAEKRGPLVSLNAEDHYVRIATTNGDHLQRIRMSDAVDMTAPLKGIRVHRSSWIALCAIDRLERDGRATFALLANGQRVRLSRAGVQLYRESLAAAH